MRQRGAHETRPARKKAWREAWLVRCAHCGASERSPMPDYCRRCGSPLEVALDYNGIRPRELFDGCVTDMWKYRALYPLSYSQYRSDLNLGEGGTPLVRASEIGRTIGLEQVWCKCEHFSPSGSFKDRSAAVGVAWAREQGCPGVICASSGNAGGAAATYAARAGLPAYLVVSSGAPKSKLSLAMAHGARVFSVAGTFSSAFAAARRAATELNLANLTTTYLNCYACEGNKSVAYELYEQMDELPDWISIPVSSGPLLYWVWKGFNELRRFGLVKRVPRLMAVQPEGCAPIARAFAQRTEVEPWPQVETVASGLDDPLRGYERDGTLTVSAVRESGGVALAVPDADILEATALLAQKEGLFVEPAAATCMAGVAAAKRAGHIDESAVVVCLLTGHGLKYQGHADGGEPKGVAEVSELIHEIQRTLH